MILAPVDVSSELKVNYGRLGNVLNISWSCRVLWMELSSGNLYTSVY